MTEIFNSDLLEFPTYNSLEDVMDAYGIPNDAEFIQRAFSPGMAGELEDSRDNLTNSELDAAERRYYATD